MKISVVIPCYRSESTIELVVNEVIDTLNDRLNLDYEIILVDDYSPDQTRLKIELICRANPKVKGIYLSKNFGQHSALMAGYSFVTGEVVVSLDDDGQTPANEMFILIDKIISGFDVVYASYAVKKHSSFRNMGSKINSIMNEKLLGKPVNINISSYFAAKKFVIAEIIKYTNPYPYVAGLVFRITKNITCVPVNHRSRLTGNSNYSFRKLVALWLNGFTAFSVVPLRASSYIGLISAIGGFILGTIIIMRKILYPSIQAGYSSIMAVLLFVSGINMLLLGMVGEYIGRMYISINNSPQYVVRETFNIENSDLISIHAD